MSSKSRLLCIFIPTTILISAFIISQYLGRMSSNLSIKSYEECVKAGNPIMESYPPQCRTSNGVVFVQTSDESIRIKGEIVCLPHKDMNGPVTLECAFGLKSMDGKYYGLEDTDLEYKNISSLPNGKIVVITGKLREAPESNYDIKGVIRIESVEK